MANMHRAYTSILPSSNKLLQQRWDTTYYNEHRRKVRDAAPMVDTRAPPTYMHLHLKLKKLQLEEERLATIERDNRILLEKMSYIMRTRGRIDNRNNYEYKSLNREKRQRELLRVTEENQAILRRITLRGAEYSAEQLQRDWEENQQFMDSISRFPKDWWKRDEKRVNSRSSQRSRRQKRNRDDVSQKSASPSEEKDDENKKDEQEESKKDEDSKNIKDSKNKKDSKTKKDTKKGGKDSQKGDNSKEEERNKGGEEDTKEKPKEEEKEKETAKG